ncbi:ABC transporter permease [Pandoraea terrigena]|uniref:ABC transporter permease n=1 Tax=Pandoraea terrigena TaxID=2508292 RepID=A0A5E4WW72_9BURK|nr:ABC transporter permease [Pandoraea terrigena]VVE27970.1 ABC transporter permease [Pandoraea terrigena]
MSAPAIELSAHGGLLQPSYRLSAALLAPSVLVIAVLLGIPLLLLLRYSLNRFVPGEFMVQALTLENYRKFMTDPFYREILVRTVYVGVVSTFAAAVLGFLPAYHIARTQSRRAKSLLIIFVILPLLMGNAVRVAGWLVILGDQGLVNAALRTLGMTTDPVKLLYTQNAVLIGTISVLLPYMIITLHSVIEGISPALEEAALGLGAGHCRMFWRVLLPMAMPGLVVGGVLCFILAMNAYATPLLIGGSTFHMMAPEVYTQISQANNWPFGAAMAFVLMFTTLVLTLVSSWCLSRRSAAAHGA